MKQDHLSIGGEKRSWFVGLTSIPAGPVLDILRIQKVLDLEECVLAGAECPYVDCEIVVLVLPLLPYYDVRAGEVHAEVIEISAVDLSCELVVSGAGNRASFVRGSLFRSNRP